MAHGDTREGKWRGNWRIEWVASILHTTLEHGVSSITTADAQTSAASSRLNWRAHPADLNGIVRFAERRNLISARVPSHFKRSLPYRRVSVSTSSLISTHCVKAYSWHAQFRGIQQVAPGQTSKTSEFVFGCWLRQWSFADRTLPSCCIWIYIALDTNLHRFAQ